MNNELMFSSKTDQWATPQYFFDELNREFDFTLDPCADESNHKCEKYYTKDVDGVSKDWSGERVFCNPPYGRTETGRWVQKCFEETQKNCDVAVMLIPARTDTKWFHNYIYRKHEVRFIKGRLKFGDGKNSAPFPSMVVVFRNKNFNVDVSKIDNNTQEQSIILCKDCVYYVNHWCEMFDYDRKETDFCSCAE